MTDLLRQRFGGGRRDWRWGDDVLPLVIGGWLARVTGDWWTLITLVLCCWLLNGLPYLILWWIMRWEQRKRRPIKPDSAVHGPQG